MRRILILLGVLQFLACALLNAAPKKTVYVSYILHGNMNYDRYVRPTIWKEFPVIYDNLLTFMDEHRDFAGQLQFSGQTISSLMQCAPQVVEHALDIHRRGQLNFTGTFYSEPVNVNMDGETNYRCCWLGTRIVEDIVGQTDGFYLQERAYHPQLPWILNHSNVTWTPVITGEDDTRPFSLRGLDGSESICVPITRSGLLDKVRTAPHNSLFTIEEDYEIPQSFTKTYASVAAYNRENSDGIEVRWITVKEYLERFGAGPVRYVDHSAKASSLENGTYSRWTADPLDIIVQDYTNRAMADFRRARIMDALLWDLTGTSGDVDFSESDFSMVHDPLVWNIERAELYPDIVSRYLANDGRVTLLSHAENLLLWAVNSDAKGWYPLYEKRRERINSFENSSLLSRKVMDGALDALAARIRAPQGFDRYYLVANMEPERLKTVTLESPSSVDVYDCQTGEAIPSESVYQEGTYKVHFEALLPSYGYLMVGTRARKQASSPVWTSGNSISSGGVTVRFEEGKARIMTQGRTVTLGMEDFCLKVLAEVKDGARDEGQWRQAAAYGPVRCTIQDGLSPSLRVERQIDWYVHLQETYTIQQGRVALDMRLVIPHPLLIRKDGTSQSSNFDPRGLSLKVESAGSGTVHYDIPYGISSLESKDTSYLCPLSTCFFQQDGGGFIVSPQTGEQAFTCEPAQGCLTLHLGASTVSGPIRDVGLTFNTPTDVDHEPAWYLEPFHGEYRHRVIVYVYQGDWKEAHVPASFREASQDVVVRQVIPGTKGSLPASQSLLEIDQTGVELTMARRENGKLLLRLNEREGRPVRAFVRVNGASREVRLESFGIAEVR